MNNLHGKQRHIIFLTPRAR